MADPIIVLVELIVPPEHRQEFLELCGFDARSSVRDEPGCLKFDVLTDPQEPELVILHEIYADQAAFDAHHATPHYAAFVEGVTRLGVVRRKLRMLSHRHP